MAGLEVQVGANIKDFQNKIKEVENDVQQLANEKAIQIKLGLDTKTITAQIKDAKKHLNDLKQTARDTGASFQKDLAPKVANGGNALMQFSRIAQDAPFGIMGIGNNITATVEAFGHLKNSTGSAGAALKAVASSMLGSGGILLAVSLVTSGLTYMSQKGLTVGDVFRKITGDFDEARRSMQELAVETAKNAQAQISSVGAYVAAAKNINLSMSDRLLAVKKLQDEYPAYFGNLSQEEILNGNVANAIRGVTLALIAKARAASLTDKIVKLAEEEEKIQNKINNEILTTVRNWKLNKKEAFEFAKILNQQLRGQINLFEEANKAGGAAEWGSKARQAALVALKTIPIYEELGDELQKNTNQQDKYTESLNGSIAAQMKLETVRGKVKKEKKPNVTDQVTGIDSSGLGGFGIIEDALILKQTAEGIYELESNIKSSLSRIPGYFDTSGQKALLKLQDFNKQLSEIVTSGTTNAISGIGEAIGSALANGGNIIDAIGKTLLSSIGSLLIDLGKATIAYGVGLLAIQTAIKNPYTAIAAGAALVVVGSAISTAVNKTASGMPGGNANTGGNYNSPGSSSSYGSSGGSSGFGGGTVVFEISGTSLIGVLSNSLDRNSRLGGALGING